LGALPLPDIASMLQVMLALGKRQSANMINVEKVEDVKRGLQPEETKKMSFINSVTSVLRNNPAGMVLPNTSITQSIPAMLLINSQNNGSFYSTSCTHIDIWLMKRAI